MHTLFRRFGLPVVLAVGVGIGSAARADDASQWTFQQFQPSGMFGFTEQRGFRPPISERDLNAAADALQLDAAQREALTDLNRSLIDEFKGEWVAFRESSVDAQLKTEAENGANDWSQAALTMMDQREALQKRQDELVDSLFTDLKLLLTPEQEKRWASVERDRRRATTIGLYALYDQEALDLVSLAKGLDLTAAQRGALEPVLDRYADEMDGVVAARNRAAQELGDKAAEFYRNQQGSQALWRTDPSKAQQMMADQQAKQQELVPMCLSEREACAKVRDLNVAYIRELEPLIPESARKDWDKAISAKRDSPLSMFMNMSRASMSIRMIENLESQLSAMSTMFGDEMESAEMMRIIRSAEPLSASQRERIKDLKDRHEGHLDEIKAKHGPAKAATDEPTTVNLLTPKGTATIRRTDAKDDNNQYGFMGMDAPNPEMIKEMRALDLETLKELREILTINQRAAISMW